MPHRDCIQKARPAYKWGPKALWRSGLSFWTLLQWQLRLGCFDPGLPDLPTPREVLPAWCRLVCKPLPESGSWLYFPITGSKTTEVGVRKNRRERERKQEHTVVTYLFIQRGKKVNPTCHPSSPYTSFPCQYWHIFLWPPDEDIPFPGPLQLQDSMLMRQW